MTRNENLIRHFYTCFQNKDYKGMQGCYADDAVFNDPVFRNLNAAEVKAMWQMLVTRGRDLQLTYSNVNASGDTGRAEWTAVYTFSATGKKVVNKIKASFTFRDGKILSHTDSFSFYRWASQALGMPGLLLGWLPFLKKKIRKSAASTLAAFMAAEKK
ncbi:nuclear transport factor 2 family protein [Foetidibacter luteolus]|uniref:nuclear transport factor 2 family protein n=1 Tax=Foetidibacter luteolus TaxID=2608880 RepID=UPI00129C0A72|nr:nuclear transport factor 2 family protein [Foetidibacter luteolus]